MSQSMDDKVLIQLDRPTAVKLLSQMMSQASEHCWCAGWLSGTEEDLPAACRATLAGKSTDDIRYFNWQPIDLAQAQVLCAFADALGHWADMEGNPYWPVCDKGKGQAE